MVLKILTTLMIGSATFASTPECRDRLGGADPQIVNYREQVCELVNQVRAENGLPAMRLSARLSNVAQNHASDMFTQGYFSHKNLLGESSFDRMKKEGITYMAAGENIAKGQHTPEAVMMSWLKSPGHRANILSPKFSKIGIGFRQSHWVQDFTN